MLKIEVSILYAELLTVGRLKHVVVHAELVKYLAAQDCFLEHGTLLVTHRKVLDFQLGRRRMWCQVVE